MQISKTDHTITQEEDGRWAITFEYLLDDTMAASYDANAGDTLFTKYYYDKDTHEQTSGTYWIEHADGDETTKIGDYVYTYDNEVVYPAKLNELLNGDMHTITLVLEDGSERVFKVPYAAEAEFLIPEGHAIYEDEACTKQYDSTPAQFTADETYYCQ